MVSRKNAIHGLEVSLGNEGVLLITSFQDLHFTFLANRMIKSIFKKSNSSKENTKFLVPCWGSSTRQNELPESFPSAPTAHLHSLLKLILLVYLHKHP